MSDKRAVVEETVDTSSEETVIKPYTMRKIKDSDLWSVLRILAKVLPDELKKAFIQIASGEKTLKEVGIMVGVDIGNMVVRNIYKAEEEVNALCADLIGVSVAELKEMEFGITPMIIMDFYVEAKKTTFFRVLSKFTF